MASFEVTEVKFMAEIKELTIPLRAAWKVPRTNRAKRAMAEVKIHVSRHMKKTDEEEILSLIHI